MKRRTFFKAVAGGLAGAAVGKLPEVAGSSTTAGLAVEFEPVFLSARRWSHPILIPQELMIDSVLPCSVIRDRLATDFAP